MANENTKGSKFGPHHWKWGSKNSVTDPKHWIWLLQQQEGKDTLAKDNLFKLTAAFKAEVVFFKYMLLGNVLFEANLHIVEQLLRWKQKVDINAAAR